MDCWQSSNALGCKPSVPWASVVQIHHSPHSQKMQRKRAQLGSWALRGENGVMRWLGEFGFFRPFWFLK